ncbi:MAG: ATP-binding cassette domain-containing protein [Negativicutes bacterium]|nr:ATP-binding cassette domain-containing protein [Negativicutes bacterium]
MITINNLVKKFGNRLAVKDLTLEIGDGEIFALLGPNGAGKTTTIRILTMLAKLNSGSVNICGYDIFQNADAVKELIGVVPQHFNLDYDLTGRENLQLQAKLHHIIDTNLRTEKIDEILSFVELKDQADESVRNYSGGMKRRLMIAMSLIHTPKVLFLDEPTVGLDPQVRRKIWDLIRSMNGQGMTVLLTTHYIEEAEALANRVAIMDHGKLIALDTPKDLIAKIGDIVVEYNDGDQLTNNFFNVREEAAKFATSLSVNATIRKANLEDVFIELTGRRVNG